MIQLKRLKISIFVEVASQQWVVRDEEGLYWTLPAAEQAWELRQPFFPAEESELTPVPDHYRYTLGLPS